MISGINYLAKMLTKKIKRSSNVGSNRVFSVKTTKYEIQKPPTFCATLFGCKFWFDVSRFLSVILSFSACLFQIKESCSRALVFFEQQILASLLVFHRAPNLSSIRPHLPNQPISALHFFNLEQFFLLRDFARQVEKAKHRPKTCNEIMLRDKLRAFISRISRPLVRK